jgi:peroxiredoxin
MKRFFTLLLCLSCSLLAVAKDGYDINVKLKNYTDSMLYIARYFGKGLPTIYLLDSTKVSKKGTGSFKRTEKLTGGLYMFISGKRDRYFEFILDNGDVLQVNIDDTVWAEHTRITGSPQQEEFASYQAFVKGIDKESKLLRERLEKARSKADTEVIYAEGKKQSELLDVFRNNYINSHPDRFLTHLLLGSKPVDVPDEYPKKADGSVDSGFKWRFYRDHYWDNFTFSDDRLIHSPLLDSKLTDYFTKVIIPHPDTFIVEADSILAKAHKSENLFKYTLNWLSSQAQTSNVMGMDKAFVHLVEQYYQKGEATWLSQEDLEKYTKRANEISPNVVGKRAPQLEMKTLNGAMVKVLNFESPYTLLVFWSPDCGHCIHEMPILDSAYRADLKARGVKIIAVLADPNEETKWREFITKNKLEDWTHVWDPERSSRYYALYDVQSTPSMYLLDKNKNIIGKKLDHTSVAKVIQMVERQKKE